MNCKYAYTRAEYVYRLYLINKIKNACIAIIFKKIINSFIKFKRFGSIFSVKKKKNVKTFMAVKFLIFFLKSRS